MSQTAGVLIIADPKTTTQKNIAALGTSLGADAVADFASARAYIQERRPSVLVFGQARGNGFEEFCRWMQEESPQSLWILSCQGLPPSQIMHWNNFGPVHDLIEDLSDPALEDKLRAAFESLGERVQRAKLVELFEEQSQDLKRLSSDLETRVEKRQKTLRKSMSTLEATKGRLESFHKALLGIHRASSVGQMEQTLSEALHASINMVWVRVRFESQSLLKQQAGPHVLSIEIPFPFESLRGEVFFSKAENGKFSSDEVDFLHELTEALGLALSRLHKLEQAETVKAQWQATFDAIPHPLCLTGNGFEILKLNRAFQEANSARGFRELIGKDCFEVFFGSGFHPPTTEDFNFRHTRSVQGESEHYEVVGQSLGEAFDGQTVHLILMRSITEDVRFERRILEASKLAELGTIGSSIAHELNNPLGGMLSFLQLILLDLKKSDSGYDEIKQMESAVLRCRDIVLNLLSFARKQDLGEFAPLELWDVIEKSVKLIELQSKSKGIAIEFTRGSSARVLGSANALSQALCNLLQNSIDAIADRLKVDPLFPGKITVTLNLEKNQYLLRLIDNGMGIRSEIQSQVFNPRFTTRDPAVYNGMGLTTAFTIINEHHGSLEILSQTGSGTTAILSLPCLQTPTLASS